MIRHILSPVRAALVALAFAMSGSLALAAFPERTVRIVVPFPAGGSNDVIARLVAQQLSAMWGQGVVVENQGGAGGNVGASAVARSDADGYTLLLAAPGPLVINETLFARLPFNPAADFAPVALVANVPILLAVNPKVEAKSVADLIALAKKSPGKLNYGSSGNGSTNHLSGEMLKSLAGIDIMHVPYRGAAPAMNDLVGGHIPMMFDNMPAVLPQSQSGAIRVLAVAGASRSKLWPEIPTMAESGVKDFDAAAWFGLVAPAKTPKAVLDVIVESTRKVLENPETVRKFAELGAERGTLYGAEFGSFMRAEADKWGKLVKASNVKLD